MSYVLASAVLGLIHVFAAAAAAGTQRDVKWNLSARDQTPPPLTGIPARLERASKNFLETYPIFLGAVLGSFLVGKTSADIETGLCLYVWARAVYLPLYALGVPVVRTLTWTVSVFGIAWIIYRGFA